MRLDGAEFPGTEVLLRWQDGLPFMQRRALGNGLILTVGLPASIDVSDLAIRPLFLSILSQLIEQAEARRGPSQSVAGATWSFPSEGEVVVQGPSGALELTSDPISTEQGARAELGRRAVVEKHGRYRVSVTGETQLRVVTLDPEEVLRAPIPPPEQGSFQAAAFAESRVDISAEVALFVLGLMALEMLVRVFGPLLKGRSRSASTEHVRR
jgi:hypothetical protein